MKRNDEYTVIVGENAYGMSKGGLDGVLSVASNNVRNGVYAAKKGKIIILMNEPNLSRERFRSLTKEYNRNGFVLLHNRGVANG